MIKKEPLPVVVVTGGARGIGKGIVDYLHKQGMQVVIADIDAEAGVKTAAQYVDNISFFTTDVADENSVRDLISEIDQRFGRLDVLINNAALANAVNASIEHLSLDAWNRILAVNLTGIFLCCKHATPMLRKTKGSIINIASTRMLQSEPDSEAYAASKGGVVALTHALAISLGPRIRVNCISPGWIDVTTDQQNSTDSTAHLRREDHLQHPCGRVGKAEDIASLAAYLLSPQASFITGQNFVVDGGMTRKMVYIE